MEFILLEDCCEILDSLRIPITASDREKGIYPYYGANGIQDYVSSYIFDDDLVLLAEDGGSFGSKTKPIAYRVSGKCWVNNHAHVLKPKEGIDVDFLCYSLMFYNTKGLVNGATRQKLTQSAIRKMKIPKLHIDIQLDIVKEIKSVISIIDNREKQLEKLSLLVRARFVEMFGDPVRNSKNWNTEKLCSIAPINKYNGDIDKFNGKVWLLNLDMIESCTGNIVDFLYEFENRITSSTIKFDENCVLYSKLRPYLNKVVIPERKGYATSELVSMSTEKINKYFLANLLRQDSFVNFSNATAYGAKMPRASMDLIKNFDVINPPTELQNQFGKLVIEVEKSKVEVQRALDEAQLLFDSLMQKYFG